MDAANFSTPGTSQEERDALDPRLVENLGALAPDAWGEIVLEASRALSADGGETLTLSIQAPRGCRKVVTPSGRLIDCVRELSRVYARHGTPWRSVRCHLTRRASPPAWDYRAEFTYPSGDEHTANDTAPSENHRRFVATLYRYLSQAYPSHAAALGEKEIRETIELGIELAASYGVKIERDVGYYLDLMFQLGVDFDDWKEMAWAKKILRRRNLTGTGKMARIRRELGLA